jgi:ATP/ADP translocase
VRFRFLRFIILAVGVRRKMTPQHDVQCDVNTAPRHILVPPSSSIRRPSPSPSTIIHAGYQFAMQLPPSSSSGPTYASVVTAMMATTPPASPPYIPTLFSKGLSIMNIAPMEKSGLAMASAMALHFFGYEFARGSNMALFTSNTLGFGSSSGSYYPLAMAFVSPASMALLFVYGKQIDENGPRKALRNTTFLCISMLAISGMTVSIMQHNTAWANIKFLSSWKLSQLVIWASFVFQNSYAHLLYAQQWSFLGSIFTPTQAGKYYSYIAGISSVSSMIAGASVSKLVSHVGLSGLLVMAAISLSCTCVLEDIAYSLSEKHGFDPSLEMKKRKNQKMKANQTSSSISDPSASQQNTGMSLFNQMRDCIALFRRVPTLGALFFEVLSFQSLSTILNTSLVTRLKDAVTDDAKRASWTGHFYASVNGLSTIFQFLIMPRLSQNVEPKIMWRFMPILPLLCAIAQFFPMSALTNYLTNSSSALYLIAASFLTAKTVDYSMRNVLAEMAYVPLPFEARFKGKEAIAVFANRFGKSGMALILSGLHFSGIGNEWIPGITLLVTLGWFSSVIGLSNL